MDIRTPLNAGAELRLGDTLYAIEDMMGYGSNAFVYKAAYCDNLQPDKTHTVLIKELFPYHPNGLITRGEDGWIVCDEDAAESYAHHKNSFMRGNAAHLDFSSVRADMTNVNINSYEMNGTVYTIVGDSNGETLEAAAKRGEVTGSLAEVVRHIITVLDALDVFHTHGLLHLDISPDNILLMPEIGGRSYRRAMLIDYNSVWSVKELPESAASFSVKESYSAPEVRLQDSSAISPASDLFSVCAIFFEFLRGEPLDFALLYSGAKEPFEETPLLSGIPAKAASMALMIVKKGLRLSPGRRYQSVLELKVDLIELLSVLRSRKRKRVVLGFVAGALLTCLLVFGFIYASEYLTSYPRTRQEIYAAENTAAALAESLGRIGRRIDNDLRALEAYNTGDINAEDRYAAANAALLRSKPYSRDYVRTMLGARSPMPLSTVTELLNAPEDYAGWSDSMLEYLRIMFRDGSIYPESDRELISKMFADYIDCYAAICYAKLRLAILPLNTDGKRPILNALPYIPLFGEKFVAQPFTADKDELESILETENVKLWDIAARLKSYGF